MYFISVDDYRKFVHENKSASRLPPAVAVWVRKFPPLQEPIRLQDLLNSTLSHIKKIDDMLYLQANEKRVGILLFGVGCLGVPLKEMSSW